MWTDDFGEYDPDFEVSGEKDEIPNDSVELDNFPNPSNFMCLDYYGLKTEDDFKKWWKENTGEMITNFRSFPTESEPAALHSSNINLFVEKRCEQAGLRKVDVPDKSFTLFKLGIGKDALPPTLQNIKFPFECDYKYKSFSSSVEMIDNDLYVLNLYLSTE